MSRCPHLLLLTLYKEDLGAQYIKTLGLRQNIILTQVTVMTVCVKGVHSFFKLNWVP